MGLALFLSTTHHVDAAMQERYTELDAKPQAPRERLRTVAGWPRRSALGHGKRMAHPAQRIVRRQSHRFLGARFHPHHVPADLDLASV